MNILLKIGAVKKSLPEWGCEMPQLTFQSFAADEFSFTTSKLNYQTAFMDFETPVELFYKNVRIFVGFIQAPVITKSGSSGDKVTISAKGLWHVFETTYYENTWLHEMMVGTIPHIGDLTKTQIFAQRYDFSYTSSGGAYKDQRFINNWSAEGFFKADTIPAFAQSNSGDLFDIFSENLNFNSDLILPFEEKDNATFNDAFEAITKWHPDLLSWFDYASAKPSLYIRASELAETVDIPVQRCPEISLTRDEERNRNVILRVIQYIKGKSPSGGFFRKYRGYVDYADSGVSAKQRNVVIIPVDITDEDYTNNVLKPDELHAQIKSIVNRDTLSGTATILDRNLLTRYVGKRLNITHSRDKLDNINVPIQTDTIDLSNGTRTLGLGSDNKPDASSFIERLEWLFSEKKTLAQSS